MAVTESNPAGAGAPTNVILPWRSLTSAFPFTQACHHRVPVRAGTRQTTVAPARLLRYAFSIQAAISVPYGGFIQHTSSPQSCTRPLTPGEKNQAHLAFSADAHTSSVKWNSASYSAKTAGGGSPSWRLLWW